MGNGGSFTFCENNSRILFKTKLQYFCDSLDIIILILGVKVFIFSIYSSKFLMLLFDVTFYTYYL